MLKACKCEATLSECTGHIRRIFSDALVSILCCSAMFIELNREPRFLERVRCTLPENGPFDCISYFISCAPENRNTRNAKQLQRKSCVGHSIPAANHIFGNKIQWSALPFNGNRAELTFHFISKHLYECNKPIWQVCSAMHAIALQLHKSISVAQSYRRACVCVCFYRNHERALHVVVVSCYRFWPPSKCKTLCTHRKYDDFRWCLCHHNIQSMNDDDVVSYTHMPNTCRRSACRTQTKQTITHQLEFGFVIFNLHSAFFRLSTIFVLYGGGSEWVMTCTGLLFVVTLFIPTATK